MGLLSLASIGCLQSMTVLHVKGLSPSGLAAALLACGGLTKVKLPSSFKSIFPQPLIEHLQVRGCSFQWSDKVFQVYFYLSLAQPIFFQQNVIKERVLHIIIILKTQRTCASELLQNVFGFPSGSWIFKFSNTHMICTTLKCTNQTFHLSWFD